MNRATRRAAVLAPYLLVHAATPPPAPGQGLVPATGGRAPATGVVLPEATATTPTRRLSVDEAVALVLENNLGIRSERYGPQIQDMVAADAPSVRMSLKWNTESGDLEHGIR